MNLKIIVTTFCLFIAFLSPAQDKPSEQPEAQPDAPATFSPWKKMGSQHIQGNKQFAPWGFIKAEETFITEKAGLTGAEAAFVFPLLHKKKELQRQVNEKMRHLGFMVYSPNISDKKCLEIINQINSLKLQEISISKEYNKKMLKGVSPKKLLRIITADHQFDREMLRHMMMGSPKGMFMKKGQKENPPKEN